jgi:hypothetical protein
MKRWTEWAENLGILSRDLLLFEALIRAVATHGNAPSSTSASPAAAPTTGASSSSGSSSNSSNGVVDRLASSHRLVICVENNLAIAMTEFMATIGFLPRGYSGSLEQVSSYDTVNMGAQATNFEKRFLDKLFTTAWTFPLLGMNIHYLLPALHPLAHVAFPVLKSCVNDIYC